MRVARREELCAELPLYFLAYLRKVLLHIGVGKANYVQASPFQKFCAFLIVCRAIAVIMLPAV